MSLDMRAQPTYCIDPIERIPVEVWCHIFMMACVDDGSTGCSLSRVSKYIRAVSAPFRYYSVGIKGLASALLFRELLERSPNICINHLFLTNDPRHKYLSTDNLIRSNNGMGFIKNALSALDWVLSWIPMSFDTRDVEKENGDAQIAQHRDVVQEALKGKHPSKAVNNLFMKAICAILSAQRQSILTLSIAYDFNDQMPLVYPALPGLPRLQELTVTVCHMVMGATVFKLLPPLSRIPELRRLNMLGVTSTLLPQKILLKCAKHCEWLTHVCLPVLRGRNLPALAYSLEDTVLMLKRRFDAEISGMPDLPFIIIVQADPWEDQREWNKGRMILVPFIKRLANIHANCLRVHQRSRAVSECPYEQEENWKGGIVGGEGGWAPVSNHQELGLSMAWR